MRFAETAGAIDPFTATSVVRYQTHQVLVVLLFNLTTSTASITRMSLLLLLLNLLKPCLVSLDWVEGNIEEGARLVWVSFAHSITRAWHNDLLDVLLPTRAMLPTISDKVAISICIMHVDFYGDLALIAWLRNHELML